MSVARSVLVVCWSMLLGVLLRSSRAHRVGHHQLPVDVKLEPVVGVDIATEGCALCGGQGQRETEHQHFPLDTGRVQSEFV